MTNDLKQMTTEKLVSNIQAIKIIMTALAIVVTLLISISILGYFFKENNAVFIPLIFVGISCGAMIPMQLSTIKKMKLELEERQKE
jgi:cyanate permease